MLVLRQLQEKYPRVRAYVQTMDTMAWGAPRMPAFMAAFTGNFLHNKYLRSRFRFRFARYAHEQMIKLTD